MLRIPVGLFLCFLGVLGIVLGAHGLYVYFSRLELLLGFGGEAAQLFMEVGVPVRLQGAVLWMSGKAIQSWFIPAAVLVGGIVVLGWGQNSVSGRLSSLLRKLRLW